MVGRPTCLVLLLLSHVSSAIVTPAFKESRQQQLPVHNNDGGWRESADEARVAAHESDTRTSVVRDDLVRASLRAACLMDDDLG